MITDKVYYELAKKKIVFYNEYFNGMGSTTRRADSKTVKLCTNFYTKTSDLTQVTTVSSKVNRIGTAMNSKVPIILISVPYTEPLDYSASCEWGSQSLWGDRFMKGFQGGYKFIDELGAQLASVGKAAGNTVNQMVDAWGLGDTEFGKAIKKGANKVKQASDVAGSLSTTNYALGTIDDFTNRFNNGAIKAPTYTFNTTVISSNALQDFCNEIRLASNNQCFLPGSLTFGFGLTPVKEYISMLAKFLCPYVKIEGDGVRTVAPNSIQYTDVRKYIENNEKEITGSYYVKVGDGTMIKNLVPSSISIKPSKLRTIYNDYLYADISIQMTSLITKNMSDDLINWIQS